MTATRDEVEALWATAIADPSGHQAIAAQAEMLFGDAENPIVDDGIHILYCLDRSGADHDTAALIACRDRWRERLAEFDADPDGWMRAYFRHMLADFAARRGERAACRFGGMLVRDGHLLTEDVDLALQDR